MPRAALRALVVAAALLPLAATVGSRGEAQDQIRGGGAVNPHLDPSLVPAGCVACHEGHGVSRSPMLPGPQREVCLSCHGNQGGADREMARGGMAPASRPPLLERTFSLPYTHPVSPRALSSREPGVVTCTSCHSPHRGSREQARDDDPVGRARLSPRDPTLFERDTCEECHGNEGPRGQSLLDISRVLNPGNASYHPVHGPARETSPSVLASLSGREINCTDCHGNSDPRGPRGPHGSAEPFLLRARYSTVDGARDRASYALCFLCHSADRVFGASPFPHHRSHVLEYGASCATCHNGHGSVRNRALIRFGEETFVSGVAPSGRTGRLAFESSAPGGGRCYVTCHGRDHSPEAYGSERTLGLSPSLAPPR